MWNFFVVFKNVRWRQGSWSRGSDHDSYYDMSEAAFPSEVRGMEQFARQLAPCWEHDSVWPHPETAGKADFEGALPWSHLLKFQAFRCLLLRLLLSRAVGKHREAAAGWGLPVPSDTRTLQDRWQLAPLGSLKVRKEDWWGGGVVQVLTTGLAWVLPHQWLPGGDTISFIFVPSPCDSLCIPFSTDSRQTLFLGQ